MRHLHLTDLFTAILVMFLCLSGRAQTQTERSFSGLEPLGHYADQIVDKNDYQSALDQVFFGDRKFEYAFLVEPSFFEEYALLIGDGTLTALAADKQVWGFLQTDKYLRVESRKSAYKSSDGDIRSVMTSSMIELPQNGELMTRPDAPKATGHSVTVIRSLTDAFVRMIEMACYTSSYLAEEETGMIAFDGVSYAFIPKGRYGGMAASVHSGYMTGPSEKLVGIMDKAYDLVRKERADSLVTLFDDMEECYRSFLSFIPDNMVKNDSNMVLVGIQFDRSLFGESITDAGYCASLLAGDSEGERNPLEEQWDGFLQYQILVKNGTMITGTVSDNIGPIAGQKVAEVDRFDFHIVQQVITDAGGNYSLAVRDNHNLLRIEREGYEAFNSLFYTNIIDCVLADAAKAQWEVFAEGDLSYQKISEQSVQVLTRNKELVSAVIPATVQGLDVVKIADSGFEGCNLLKSVKIPETVVMIGDKAFTDCVSLESIVIPESVTRTGKSVFSGCTNLKEVYNSSIFFYLNPSYQGEYRLKNAETVRTIAGKAFYGCAGLTSVDIPGNVTEIGDGAFASSGIDRIVLPEALTRIAPMSFDGCRNLVKIDIPDKVIRIGAYAFSGCGNLENVAIPNSVTFIDNAAFSECTGLKSVVLPEYLFYLPEDLLAGCTGMEELSLPVSIELIGNGSMGCSNLKALNVYWNEPAAYEWPAGDPFRGLNEPDCTLYVPKGSASAYKAAYSWQLFNIVERE